MNNTYNITEDDMEIYRKHIQEWSNFNAKVLILNSEENLMLKNALLIDVTKDIRYRHVVLNSSGLHRFPNGQLIVPAFVDEIKFLSIGDYGVEDIVELDKNERTSAKVKEIVIPDSVRCIEFLAFVNFEAVKTIKCPKRLQEMAMKSLSVAKTSLWDSVEIITY